METGRLGKVDALIALAVGICVFVVYVLTLAVGAYPGEFTSALIQGCGLFPRLAPDYPVWFGLSGGEMEAFGYGWSLPATTIIDRDGRIAASFRGAVSREALSAELEKLLSARPAVVSGETGKP